MQKVILIRFGELFLKGRNRGYFEKVLIKNIKDSLSDIKFSFLKTQNRYYIENFDECDQEIIIDRVTKVFGIHSISVAVKVPSNLESLAEHIKEFTPEGKTTFRVTVNRADKSIGVNSIEISKMLGGSVLSVNHDLTVDLHYPKSEIFVDIREKGFAYIFRDKIMGAQGMPNGTAGKGMVLLSGGIDSPVATYRMAKRGMEIYAIHFHSYPHTSEQAKQKVIDLAQILTAYCGRIKLFVVPFTNIQQAIHEKCDGDYMITIMRRIMVDIAERLAIENDCGALITGESLAQVASQTTESITVTNEAVKTLPVFRPLIGMDKTEIIETAQAIGTLETSNLPYQDCCTVFLPKNPVIHPKLTDAKFEQDKIDNLENLIQEAIKNTEYLKIKPNYRV